MIREETAHSLSPLLNKLEASGVRLKVMENTPLAELADATIAGMYSMEPLNGSSDGSLPERDTISLLLEASREKNQDGICEHDVVMDEVVETVAKTVSKNLDGARNIIVPKIKDVAEEAKKQFDEIGMRQVIPVAVAPDYLKDTWYNPFIAGMFEKFVDVEPENVDLIGNFPDLTGADLQALMKNDTARWDEELAKFLGNFPDGYLEETYRRVFSRRSDGAYTYLTELTNTSRGDRDRTLLVHLMARRLLADVPEGVRMDIANYRLYLNRVIAQTGRACMRFREAREKEITRKTLVMRYPIPSISAVEDGEITVVGAVYKQFLEAGGSPEVILGAYATDRERDFTALLEKAEAYKNAWLRYVRLFEKRVAENKLANTISSFRRAMINEINEMAEDEELVIDADHAKQRLTDLLSSIKENDTDDFYIIARKLVCRVLYAHTDGEKILCAIDKITEDNPEMDIREAALLAMVDIVADWVSAQIVV